MWFVGRKGLRLARSIGDLLSLDTQQQLSFMCRETANAIDCVPIRLLRADADRVRGRLCRLSMCAPRISSAFPFRSSGFGDVPFEVSSGKHLASLATPDLCSSGEAWVWVEMYSL